MATSKRGTWATIRRIAASDRISGLIMLGFALAGLLLANLPFTAHAFEQLENFRIAIPHTNIDMGLGHWVQDGLLTVFFLTVGLELKQVSPRDHCPIPKPRPCRCCARLAVCLLRRYCSSA